MSVQKTGKFTNVVQQKGLLHLGSAKSTTSDAGFVSEYTSGSTSAYAGLVRDHTSGIYYAFDGLASNPFLADAVDRTDASLKGARYNFGQVTSDTAIINTQLITPNVVGTNALTLGSTSCPVLVTQAPTNSLGVVNKGYVDGLIQGFVSKASAIVATTSDLSGIPGGLTVAGSAATKTLSSTGNRAQSSDASYFDNIVTFLGDRVLVMSQANTVDNGIYYFTQLGSSTTPWVLTRAADANASKDFANGAFIFVEEGTQYQSTGWVLQGPFNNFVLDTSPLIWVKFSKNIPQVGVQDLSSVAGSATTSSIVNVLNSNTLNFRALTSTTGAGNFTQPIELVESTNAVTLNLDSSKITAVGALSVGSIVAGFGGVVASTLSTASTLTFANSGSVLVPTLSALALTIKDSANTYLTVDSSAKSIAIPTLTSTTATLTTATITKAVFTASGAISVAASIVDAFDVTDGTNNYININTSAPAIAINQSLTASKGLYVMGGATIDTLDVTSAPTKDTSVVTRGYLSTKSGRDSVRVVSYTPLLVTSTGTGSSHVLTSTTNSVLVVDSVSLAVGDRVLVAANGSDNGIYLVVSAGSTSASWSLQRTVDASSLVQLQAGVHVAVVAGTLYKQTEWILTVAATTLETSTIVFAQMGELGLQLQSSNGAPGSTAIVNLFRDNNSAINFRSLTAASTTTSTSAVELVETLTNVAINFDSTKITSVGAVAAGSLASGFGTISSTGVTTPSLAFATAGKISLPATTSSALDITDGSNHYIQFDTSAKTITLGSSTVSVTGANIKYTSGTFTTLTATTANIATLNLGPTASPIINVQTIATNTILNFSDSTTSYLQMDTNSKYLVATARLMVANNMEFSAADTRNAISMPSACYTALKVNNPNTSTPYLAFNSLNSLESSIRVGTTLNLATTNINNSLSVVNRDYIDTLRGKNGVDVRTTLPLSVTKGTTGSITGTSDVISILTSTSNGDIATYASSFDGVQLTYLSSVLVMNQVSQGDNGIYTVLNVGSASAPWVLARRSDARTSSTLSVGSYVFVAQGALYSAKFYSVTTSGTTFGTDPIVFTLVNPAIQTLTFSGVSGSNYVQIPDSSNDALDFRGATSGLTYLQFNSAVPAVQILQPATFASTSTFTGVATFGTAVIPTLNATAVSFLTATSGTNSIQLTSNIADALSVQQGTSKYLTFDTVAGSESILLVKNTTASGTLTASGAFTAASTSTFTGLVTAGDATVQGKLLSTSQFTMTGGMNVGLSSLSVATTLGTQNAVNVTAGATDLVITLPSANSLDHQGRCYKLVKADTGAGRVLITPSGTDTIDGTTLSVSLDVQYDHTHLTSHGVLGWFLH